MKKNLFHLSIITIFILYFLVGRKLHITIPCQFHKITGLWCPGCGITRMFISIFRGNLIQAFRCNQLLFISSPIMLFLYIDTIICNFKDKKPLYKKIPDKFYYSYIVLLIIFMILRNIFPVLAPIVI